MILFPALYEDGMKEVGAQPSASGVLQSSEVFFPLLIFFHWTLRSWNQYKKVYFYHVHQYHLPWLLKNLQLSWGVLD